jgi:hypothetical protein
MFNKGIGCRMPFKGQKIGNLFSLLLGYPVKAAVINPKGQA